MHLLSALQALILMFAPINEGEIELEQTGFRIQVYPYGGYYAYPNRCPPGYYYGYRYGYPGCYGYGYGRGYGYYSGPRYYYGPRYYNRYPRRHHGRKYRKHHGGKRRHHKKR